MPDNDIAAERRRARNKKIAKIVALLLLLALIILGLFFGTGFCDRKGGDGGTDETKGQAGNTTDGEGATDTGQSDPIGNGDTSGGDEDPQPDPRERAFELVVTGDGSGFDGNGLLRITGPNGLQEMAYTEGDSLAGGLRDLIEWAEDRLQTEIEADPSWATVRTLYVRLPTNANGEELLPRPGVEAEIRRDLNLTFEGQALNLTVEFRDAE